MVVELGHYLLILALVVSVLQSILPLVGVYQNNHNLMKSACPAAIVVCTMVVTSFIILIWAFISHDFSVSYVVANSNSELPLVYRISGTWGAHEGSLLLWVVILSCWMAAVVLFSKQLPKVTQSIVLATMAMIMVGFLLFILFTSNPFARILPPLVDGRDLNPLLQDPGLIIHPPMLYMGYVGFSVAFAFAVAGLVEGKIDSQWARWLRPWLNTAWLFLTLGIALGSWWAYYELGWGGWWFWDPVENASFMPWLVATALIHSLAVTEQRQLFKAWTVLLAILTFSLSLLGTFLVRSGVITSVHAFANDPSRGIFILLLLLITIGGSLLLYSIRVHKFGGSSGFHPVSRESALLMNNLFLVVAAASILIGTIYPLIFDALGWGKLSVGSPYFNAVFIPLMVPLAFLVGIGSFAKWRKESINAIVKTMWLPFILSIIIGLLVPFLFDSWKWQAFLGSLLASWIILSSCQNIYSRVKTNIGSTLRSLPMSFYAMILGHVGMAVFIIGATFASLYSVDKNISLAVGESTTLKEFGFEFLGIKKYKEQNYHVQEGIFTVRDGDGVVISVPPPQKRFYPVQRQSMTEAGIKSGIFYDLYISLGEQIDKEQQRWSMRIYYRSFVNWIWLGALIMAFAAFLELFDKRYLIFAKKGKLVTP